MFWRKRKTTKIDKQTKKEILEELKALRNKSVTVTNEIDRLKRIIEGIK
tara:strand:+ start:1761 stop:1907 length:147 start_codon:yes stop_codon:yes gene_type:complete